MTKSAVLNLRIEPEIKADAEELFSNFGLTVTDAVNVFLRQSLIKGGFPFEIKLPQQKPLDYSTLTKEEFDTEMEKGYADIKAGRVVSAKQVRENIQRKYRT